MSLSPARPSVFITTVLQASKPSRCSTSMVASSPAGPDAIVFSSMGMTSSPLAAFMMCGSHG